MKKINGLIKYELLDLIRSKIIWIMLALYIFGVEQSISSMYVLGQFKIGFVSYFKTSWLPLNLVMFPLLIIGVKVGMSRNQIFETFSISIKEKVMSKLICMVVVGAFIWIPSMIITIIMACISKTSFLYFINLFLWYITNLTLLLVITSVIGLIIGEVVTKRIGEIPTFLILLAIFVLLCNFYKEGLGIIPLYYVDTFASTFEFFTYDKLYIYHIVFWLIFLIIGVVALFLYKIRECNVKSKQTYILNSILGIGLCLCIFIIIKILPLGATFYDITSNIEYKDSNGNLNNDYINNQNNTYYHSGDIGYYVSKYDMNLTLQDNFKNICNMEIKITNPNTKFLEFGLFYKMNISKIYMDNKEINFERIDNHFKVNIPQDKLENRDMNLTVEYDGNINTEWLQGRKTFFVKNSSMFLADVFEWYPKLNDEKFRDYNLNIDYKGNNKIYSNLEGDGKNNFEGNDREIFLVSGKVIEKNYSGYTLVGNEEYFKTDKQCDNIINSANKRLEKDNLEKNIDTIILTKENPDKVEIQYKKTYLLSGPDIKTHIFNK